jgi:acetyltransferase-like isoleucine patch superfamily enzyme
MLNHINDVSKPLVFLGSNWNMFQLTELAEDVGITIAGILDSDYYGNTEKIGGYPVIGSEDILNDGVVCEKYRNKYNFFCATNWAPMQESGAKRSLEKRQKYIGLIKEKKLNCISLIDPSAKVSRHAIIGKNVFVDAQVYVEPECIIEDFVRIYFLNVIGHGSVLRKNATLQRRCILAAKVTLEEDVYFGPSVIALKTNAVFGKGTFIHECIYIKRNTLPGEIVSLESENQKRVIGL